MIEQREKFDGVWSPCMVQQGRQAARDVVFGYLTQLVTARSENIGIEEKWETTRPPTSRSKEPPAMLEMVFASRSVRGRRGKEWTDFGGVFGTAFVDGKIPMYRNPVNPINGKQTRQLFALLRAPSTLSTWDVLRCSSRGVCKYAKKR